MEELQWRDEMKKKRGGFSASSFIFVLIGLDNMGFVANMSTLVLYFLLVMHFDVSTASNTLTNLLGSCFLLSLLGGFISDTYLSRLTTSLIFGAIEILALAMLTIEARSKQLQPDACGKSSCLSGGKSLYFYVTLGLYALGTGGVRGALPALGADQFDQRDPVEAKDLATFFNWLILSSTIGSSIGVTAIVWVDLNKGWHWGFMIATISTFVGLIVLASGKPLYRLQRPNDSPIIRIAQVIFLAFKNRKLPIPKSASELYEISNKESILASENRIAHTDQFRFLDKAAILTREPNLKPWKVCSVTQVEETFSVQQGRLMNPHLGSFKVPTPSIPIIPLIFMSILIPIYEFIFVPFARKFTGHPSGITRLQRVGVGLVLAVISMTIAGVVEVRRRDRANKDPHHPISLFWITFQYCIFGIADMFTLAGMLEFFYKEAPAGMKSLSTSFTWLSFSLGYFLSSIFVNVINFVTERVTPSKQGWLHGLDINKNNLDLFYYFLAIISVLNFVAYLFAASWYKYKADDPDLIPHTQRAENEPPNAFPVNAREAAFKVDEPTTTVPPGNGKEVLAVA
ncbi:hypothetical protein MLD38_020695 [Melastoma candidum]|uniref:Uncharacterized protein n=1 Tax=Melastoma candidum TaxID=119954 RepID=A0ACB9QDT9_9MYRT|nr:hypothetical protein MLD38_020695 [Melastoma candidum]